MSKFRVGILTSGGDCPGLNAVIRAVVSSADKLGWEVLGFNDGYEGLLSPVRYRVLDLENTANIMSSGGTILGTTNKGRFVAKVGFGDHMQIDPQIIAEAKQTLQSLNVQALICIGGDGSLLTGQQLFEAGIPVVGVPKTIDNDISATQITFGFDSAVECVADALDRLHTTAMSHHRVMVLEVMGRHTGWIALYGGLAGGANVILLPEIPFTYENLAKFVNQHVEDEPKSMIVVVAEGAAPQGGKMETRGKGAANGEHRLGGIGLRVAEEIAQRTKQETREVVLGHMQRGGDPTTLDRILGTRFGVGAIQLIQEKRFGRMVSYHNHQVGSVSILEATGKLKKVPADNQLLTTARAIGIYFGD